MTTYYHVAPADHTGDLESLAAQHGESEAIELYTTRWPEAGELALNGHAGIIHLYDTIEEARSHKDAFGGKIYAVDGEAMEDDFIKIRRDTLEFDHPVCDEAIGAEYLEEIE
jgi:hypothetical protein